MSISANPWGASIMLIGVLAVFAPSQAGDTFIDHGVAAPVSRARGVAAALDGDGRPIVLAWLADHRGTRSLAVIDAGTGNLRQHAIPINTSGSPFAILMADDGIFYAQFGTGFFGFDPRKEAFTVQRRTPIDGLAMSLTEDGGGIIWACLYPDSQLLRYDPKNDTISSVQLNKENWQQYPSYLACDNDGWVYAGIGNTTSHIVGYHHATSTVKPMLRDGDRKPGISYVYRGADGKVYGRAYRDGPWFELAGGEATSIDKPDVAPAPIKHGSQETVLRAFGDGRTLVDIDIAERWMSVRDAPGEEPRRVTFDYESDGSHIQSLIQTADGRMHGSTGHPLRVFTFDPRIGSTEHRGLLKMNGHLNAMAIQRGLVYGACYGPGGLWEIDFDKPWQPEDEANPNPALRLRTDPHIGRPHACMAHRDGRHVIVGGTPGYGMTGGGLLIYDVETQTGDMLTHEQVLPQHSTFALAALRDGTIVGGTTIAAGTGGPAKVQQAEVYLFDLTERKVIYHNPVVPGASQIRDIITGPDDRVYGFSGGGTLFVFDPASRQVIHRDDLSTYGALGGVQGPRIMTFNDSGDIIVLFSEAIVRIDPTTYQHEQLAALPVKAGAGPILHDGRVYFTSDSHIWSYGR